MKSKNIYNSKLIEDYYKPLNNADLCEVSKASAEIMLDRFSNGKEIDFPFAE